jgi:hypothetical protein
LLLCEVVRCRDSTKQVIGPAAVSITTIVNIEKQEMGNIHQGMAAKVLVDAYAGQIS